LAESIEEDRQKNGNFGSVQGLRRVKGIGPGRLKSFSPYFQGVSSLPQIAEKQ